MHPLLIYAIYWQVVPQRLAGEGPYGDVVPPHGAKPVAKHVFRSLEAPVGLSYDNSVVADEAVEPVAARIPVQLREGT